MKLKATEWTRSRGDLRDVRINEVQIQSYSSVQSSLFVNKNWRIFHVILTDSVHSPSCFLVVCMIFLSSRLNNFPKSNAKVLTSVSKEVVRVSSQGNFCSFIRTPSSRPLSTEQQRKLLRLPFLKPLTTYLNDVITFRLRMMYPELVCCGYAGCWCLTSLFATWEIIMGRVNKRYGCDIIFQLKAFITLFFNSFSVPTETFRLLLFLLWVEGNILKNLMVRWILW